MRGGFSPQGSGRRRLLVALVGVLVLGAAATQAFATITQPVVAEDSTSFLEEGGVDGGDQGTFMNNDDSATHNVTANGRGPDKGPLFKTGNTPANTIRAIRGTEFLTTGNYAFRCTIHPVMEGTLTVDEARGPALPRPDISLKVKSKKLAKVVDSGKLQVKVKAADPTRAENVTLKAKKGKKGITKAKKLNLAAGGSKTVKLKLSKGGSEKLAAADSAKVKVEGTVDFGFGDKASKKLK